MANGKQQKMIDILLVEDNPGDVILIKEALKEGQVLNKLTVLGDGEAALSFLRKERRRIRKVFPPWPCHT